jgi:hypothetical protein
VVAVEGVEELDVDPGCRACDLNEGVRSVCIGADGEPGGLARRRREPGTDGGRPRSALRRELREASPKLDRAGLEGARRDRQRRALLPEGARAEGQALRGVPRLPRADGRGGEALAHPRSRRLERVRRNGSRGPAALLAARLHASRLGPLREGADPGLLSSPPRGGAPQPLPPRLVRERHEVGADSHDGPARRPAQRGGEHRRRPRTPSRRSPRSGRAPWVCSTSRPRGSSTTRSFRLLCISFCAAGSTTLRSRGTPMRSPNPSDVAPLARLPRDPSCGRLAPTSSSTRTRSTSCSASTCGRSR